MVRIPIEFKESILSRFDPKNAISREDIVTISIPCILCVTFGKECSGCPFNPKNTKDNRYTCVSFIEKLVPTLADVIDLYTGRISWSKEEDKLARKLLNKFRKKLIEEVVFYGEKQVVFMPKKKKLIKGGD